MMLRTHQMTLMLSPILIFLSMSSCCRVAPITECSQFPFIPGHDLVGKGFDIVLMKTMGAFVVNVQDYIIGGEHGNCTICRNSLLGREEKLPAAVTDWRVKVNCKRSISTQLLQSTASMVKQSTRTTSMSWKMGLSVPSVAGLALAGTHSKSVMFAKSHASQDRFFYARHEFSCRYYNFQVRTNPPLTRVFLQSVKSLPLSYTSQTESAFHHFISIYGTHYMRQVTLGGRVQSITAVRTCQVSMQGLTAHVVSNCLSQEASAVIEGVQVRGLSQYCKGKSNKLQKTKSFSGSFSDRVTEVWGGKGNGDLLFSPDKQHGYRAWLKTLHTIPGVVSYTLTSLHMLVRNDVARRAALQKAISMYVMKNAVYMSCPSKCRIGHRGPDCTCKCRGHQRVNSDCCPSQPGVAELTVTVERATGLWGDYISKTDAYVNVLFGKRGQTTQIIMNNDFPVWNYVVRFGTVVLTKKRPVRFEVWDRDNKWDDDRLGVVNTIPTRGVNVKKQFCLKHGTLFISITAICAPNLQGKVCERYAPAPEAELLTYPELLQGQRRTWTEERYGTVAGNATLL